MNYTNDGGETLVDEWELEADFRDLLDEVYPEVEVGAFSWPASTVLEDMDPIGFRGAFLDWLDAEGYEEA